MEYFVEKSYRTNKKLRNSFNALAKETFHLDFEKWYQNGYWTDIYNPYSIVINKEVAANVSVNIMKVKIKNVSKQYIQLGTVMTKKNYRNQGYIRILMDQIEKNYKDYVGKFLWANDSVSDFYPKFGFEECRQYRYRKDISITERASVERVSMKDAGDWKHFLIEKHKRRSNCLVELDNDGLLMFYLSQFMQENVFYINRLDAYVIAEKEGNTLVLHDIYSRELLDINEVCHAFGNQIEKVKLAFTPKDCFDFHEYEYREANSTFFVSGVALKTDMEKILCFSELAHA